MKIIERHFRWKKPHGCADSSIELGGDVRKTEQQIVGRGVIKYSITGTGVVVSQTDQ